MRCALLIGKCFLVLITCFTVESCNKSENKPGGSTETNKVSSAANAESPVAKLDKIGVKSSMIAPDQLLISEGFPFEKIRHERENHIITIAKIEGSSFTASNDSAVPTVLPFGQQGMIYGVQGGSFMPKCTGAKTEETTLADAIGVTWVFPEAGMSFGVRDASTKKLSYRVTSRKQGAAISFSENGVVLKDFSVELEAP